MHSAAGKRGRSVHSEVAPWSTFPNKSARRTPTERHDEKKARQWTHSRVGLNCALEARGQLLYTSMSATSELACLLVEPSRLPQKLEGALAERGVYVETTSADGVSGMVVVSSPDAIVAPESEMERVAHAVRCAPQKAHLPIFVVASRSTISRSRGRKPPEITAVLPVDLPASAIARRIVHTLGSITRPAKTARTDARATQSKPKEGREWVPRSPELAKTQPLRAVTEPKPPLRTPIRAASWPKKRVTLEMPAQKLPALRVALLDHDSTRADAIARALRQAGQLVFLVSGSSGRSRWPLLRGFAPQAVIADETGISQDGGEWIAAFRGDPFLGRTPVIISPLEELFDPEEGNANISRIAPQLEGLARAEATLSAELRPGVEVEVNRAQINPGRLLALMAESERPAELECEVDSELLTWPIAGKRVGLAHLKKGANTEELEPEAALRWLLRRTHAPIVVRRIDVTKLVRPVSTSELLKRAYRADLPAPAALVPPGSSLPPSVAPAETCSEAPALGNVEEDIPDGAELESPANSEIPTHAVRLSDLHIPAEALRPAALGLSPQELEAHPAPPSVDAASPRRLVRRQGPTALTSELPHGEAAAPKTTSRPTPPGVERRINPGDTWSRWALALPLERLPKPHWLAAAAALLIVSSVGMGAWLLGGDSDSAATLENAAAAEGSPPPMQRDDSQAGTRGHPQAVAQGSPEPAHEKQSTTAPPPAGSAEFWKTRRNDGAVSCETVLGTGRKAFAARPRRDGQALWKKARQKMLAGDQHGAHQLMCQSAFIDPSGPASIGLGTYYLTRGSLIQAENWARFGVENRTGSKQRMSKELLGDVLIQKGDVDEAVKLWLETMRLEPSDRGKIEAVARALTRHAADAKRGDDHPRAERLLRRAAALDAKNSAAASGLAGALLENGEKDLARIWAQRALQMDDNAAEALFVLGTLAQEAGNIAEARTYYSRIPPKTSFAEQADERLASL